MPLNEGTTPAVREQLKILLGELERRLKVCNQYVRDFITAAELPDNVVGQGRLVIRADLRPDGEHERRYNTPTGLGEVCLFIANENMPPSNIVIQRRRPAEGPALVRIPVRNPAFDPLHYVLLFPEGDRSYYYGIPYVNGPPNKFVTPREYYVFLAHERRGKLNTFLRAGRLFQEFLCVAQYKAEFIRLEWVRNHQTELRAESYNVLTRAVLQDQHLAHDGDQRQLGQAVILPASFTGGPRFMRTKYHEAMAIVRKLGKSHLFITMTANPKHPDVLAQLFSGQTAADRPDIVARVFRLHLNALINDLKSGAVPGWPKAIAHLYVIEFQKRGLPHAHILIFLDAPPISAEEISRYTTAELPNKETDPVGFKLMTEMMLHSPCGEYNPDAACMKNGKNKCHANFPKQFSSHDNFLESSNATVVYRRRSQQDGGPTFTKIVAMGGQRKEFTFDNRWVVPTHLWLLKKYQCHINVEVCNSIKSCKYLFKYVHKGSDRGMVRAVCDADNDEPEIIDEVQEYQDARSIGASEAAWRLFDFDLTDRDPAVFSLHIHLEDEQRVVFEDAEQAAAQIDTGPPKTHLTQYFAYNQANPATRVQYDDFPEQFVWKNKAWSQRKRGMAVGRVVSIHPRNAELFFLRMLLCSPQSAGAQSFKHLRTVDGAQYDTYRDACNALGLLQDDREWQQCIEDAAEVQMPVQMRQLFVYIITNNIVANPNALFDEFWEMMGDDFFKKAAEAGIDLDVDGRKDQLCLLVRLTIAEALKTADPTNGGQLLPLSDEEVEAAHAMQRELCIGDQNIASVWRGITTFDPSVMEKVVHDNEAKLTSEQKHFYDSAMAKLNAKEQFLAFVDAPGGTGKTFTFNTLIAKARLSSFTVLIVASSGIAATMLIDGRTFHSRFKSHFGQTLTAC